MAGLGGLSAFMLLYQLKNYNKMLENGENEEDDDEVYTSAAIDAHLTGLE